MTVRDLLRTERPFTVSGRVSRVTGHHVDVAGLRLRIGDGLTVHSADGPRPAEVVAVEHGTARALLYDSIHGVGQDDAVTSRAHESHIAVDSNLFGRVIDGLGRPLDGGPPLATARDTGDAVPSPLERRRIDAALPVGVRAIDTFCTVGRGQRMGIFGGSGVGKSTLLGMMARGTTADANVIALIGERSREVREFIEDELGPEGMAKTVVVVATSDKPALMRRRGASLATRIAERLADQGADVLLMMDSLTRLAMAQREIGLAAGEPPTARGYTPSVFTLLPALLERAGPRSAGTVTGFYSVLVEGDDLNDPIADTARSILDGHIVLDRTLANGGHYPAINPLISLSRLADKLMTDRQAVVHGARNALAAAEDVRDLVEVGAYVPGTNPEADRGLALKPNLMAFLRQTITEPASFDESWQRLAGIVGGQA